MEYRTLGKTELKVSVIGFGCWQMGKKWWEGTKDEETIPAVNKAIDLGINLFDTADVYGFGHSEKILAKALGKKRKDIILATKVGLEWSAFGKITHNLSKKYILKAVDKSLKRLNTDYIDIYQAHWPDPNTPVEETMEAFNELKKSGKIRYIGVSNFNTSLIKGALKFGEVQAIQPSYNIFQREYEKDTLPFCLEKEIGVITYSSIAKGLLSGKYNKDTTFGDNDIRKIDVLFRAENFKKNLQKVEKLKGIASSLNRPLVHLAVAWNLSNPAVTSALVGIKRSSQVEEIADATDLKLDKNVLQKIDEICKNNA